MDIGVELGEEWEMAERVRWSSRQVLLPPMALAPS
jgi:hypothetical protein